MEIREQQDSSSSELLNLDCFLNQPNINMVIPWIYEIYQAMKSANSSSRDSSSDDLSCFLNQPNINMTIPWIHEIYQSVKENGIGVTIEDLTEDDD